MRKFIFIFFVILIGAVTLAQCPPGTPEYLYRCLDIRCYKLLNLGGLSTCDTSLYIESKNIHWFGGIDFYKCGYHETDAVNDKLYGYFSTPVKEVGDSVVLDSVLLCFYTADGPDEISNAELQKGSCDSCTWTTIATPTEDGSGSTGWEWTDWVFGADSVVKDRSGYRFYIETTADSGDVRVKYYAILKYYIVGH